VETLQAALKDKDPEVRLGAALALRNLGPEARAAAPALTDAMKDPNQQVRIWAALAMTKIAPNDPAVVPGLIEALKDREPNARHAAALSLGLIGIDQPAAKQAATSLADVAKNDSMEEIRKAATAALKLIDPEAAAKAGLQ
jgi:HEAT repeat protein